MNITSVTAATMTSLELVDFINSHRQRQAEAVAQPFPSKGYAKLEHADFMKKAVEVLGANAGNFSGIYRDSRNREQQCYRFPKRESCLMAMSYSYDLQAAVFDHMTALEAALGAPGYVPRTRAEALRLAADLEERAAALQLENQKQAEAIASLESLFLSGETPTQFCKRLNGVNCSRVNSTLLEIGWLYDENRGENGSPRYRVASRVRDKYLTERPRKISPEGGDAFIKYDLQLLLAGAQRLHQLYMQQKLAMKSTWDGRFTQAKHTGETI
jgi:hypothetical protein